MLTVSSQAELLGALASGRSVLLTAYVLRRGPLLRALEAAADRGARVKVRLEGRPYGDDSEGAGNKAVLDELRTHGADARRTAGDPPLHLKAAVVDGSVFLDDRNWPEDGRDLVLRSQSRRDAQAIERCLEGRSVAAGSFATRKSAATALEASLIGGVASRTVDCETESFGPSNVAAALRRRALQGDAVRLLVSERELAGPGGRREAAALRRLAAAGVSVRAGPDSEKLVVAGAEAWAGSANATRGEARQIDWGARSRDPDVVTAARARFERNWACARPL